MDGHGARLRAGVLVARVAYAFSFSFFLLSGTVYSGGDFHETRFYAADGIRAKHLVFNEEIILAVSLIVACLVDEYTIKP